MRGEPIDLVRLQLLIASGGAARLHAGRRQRNGPRDRGAPVRGGSGQRLPARRRAADDLRACGRRHASRGKHTGGRASTATMISVHYDPLLAKVIACAATRVEAATTLAHSLESSRIHGIATNRDFLVAALRTRGLRARRPPHRLHRSAPATGGSATRRRTRSRWPCTRSPPPCAVRGRGGCGRVSSHPCRPAGATTARNRSASPSPRPQGEPVEVGYSRNRDGPGRRGCPRWSIASASCAGPRSGPMTPSTSRWTGVGCASP
jgi:hypothetical protein